MSDGKMSALTVDGVVGHKFYIHYYFVPQSCRNERKTDRAKRVKLLVLEHIDMSSYYIPKKGSAL